MDYENDDEEDYDCGTSGVTWNESDCVYVHVVKEDIRNPVELYRLESVEQRQT
jgi:hypothetical protein